MIEVATIPVNAILVYKDLIDGQRGGVDIEGEPEGRLRTAARLISFLLRFELN